MFAVRCSLLTLALLLLPTVSMPAFSASGDAGVVARQAPLRKSPNPIAKAVATLPAKTPVTILGKRGYWVNVKVNATGAKGWLRSIRVRRDYPAEAAANPKSDGNVFASIARRTTTLVGGNAGRGSGETTTIGIRGLSAESLSAAQPNLAELKRLDSYRTSNSKAASFARQGKLQVSALEHKEPEGFSTDSVRNVTTSITDGISKGISGITSGFSFGSGGNSGENSDNNENSSAPAEESTND